MRTMNDRFAASNELGKRWLLCRSGGRGFALPLEGVVMTMRRPELRPWRTQSPFILGVATIRGEATPVVSVSQLLYGEDGAAPRLVVVEAGERRVALGVDEVLEVSRLSNAVVAELPPLLRDDRSEHVTHLARLDRELWELLAGGVRLLEEVVDVASPEEVP